MDPKEEQILNKINSGEIKMRPKYFFVLRGIMIGLAAILFLLVAAFLISFIFYIIRPGAASAAGLRIFYSLFPWVLLGIAILFLAGLAFLLKQYPFVYRKPLILLPLGIIAAVVLISIAAQLASVHERLERRQIRGFERFYRIRHRPAPPSPNRRTEAGV